MSFKKSGRSWYRRLTFHGLSIQQRLPLLICVLLSIVIIVFSLLSYYGVKKSAIEIGKNRLRTLTDELAAGFSQSSDGLSKITLAAARHDTIKKCLQSGGTAFSNEATILLNNLRKDSTWVLLELLDSNRNPVLRVGDETAAAKLNLTTIFSSIALGADSFKVGKAYAVKDSMFYPVVCAVQTGKKIIGYLVSWRSLSTTPQALQQLTQLLGTGATLYIGNTDGSLWTNLVTPIAAPPIDMGKGGDFFEYNNRDGKKVIAAIKPIEATQWLLLIEFSEQTILETATRFLKWIIIAGSILIVLGIFITWLMSRNIIKPLNQLTAAATAIAAGDYSSTVKVNRLDELGKLADAFNEMVEQVQLTQQHLENKVSERTSQLETANKELEAFSYSISHDLRSPLRGIVGFTSMLKDKYSDQLDDEGKRIIEVITGNTLKMGDLIDDLLSFFRTGRQDIIKSRIPTDQLVNEIVVELDNKDHPVTWLIHPLPESYGDVNSIRQVWINLIANAIKYSRNESNPYIEIGALNDDNTEVTFFIKDNGVGFDPQYKDKLFKVFQRLHSHKEFEGTGVGLAIVERIVSKHGGKVWVEAERNAGATFYFSLPHK